jgi:ribosome-associated protein
MEFQLKGHEYIELKNLLKMMDLVNSGGEAKHIIRAGEVTVDGDVELRPGKKLRAGEIVVCSGQQITIKE